MATKQMLLAIADPQAVVDINQALGAEWLTTPVVSVEDAFALLEGGSFDAILADFNLGDPDASELMNQAVEKCPEITRFLLAYEADLALIAAKVHGLHEILPKPFEASTFRCRIESAFSGSAANQTGGEHGNNLASTPAIPSVYAEVLEALESPEVTSKHLGKIIARDTALTAELLNLTRSAYLGLPGEITDPAKAVELLGRDTVAALALGRRYLAEHSHFKPCYLSLEHIWMHSTEVAQIARDLVLFETKDRALAAQALAAGLLHDLGKVVLATNFDDLYGRVHSLARKQPVPLWEIEKEMFGASHAEIGACLLGMWNMPPAIIDAATFHHEPPVGEDASLTPMAAVHIANVLAHQLQANEAFRVVPVVNTPFLNQLGLLQRLPVWRATFANRRQQARAVAPDQSGPVATLLEAEPPSQTANQLSGPSSATSTTTSGARPRQWVYTGIAAAVLFLLAVFLRMEFEEPTHVSARTFTHQPTEAVSTTANVEPVPASEAGIEAITFASREEPATSDSPAPSSIIPVPASEPATQMPVSLPAIRLRTAEITPPAFRLNGVIYSHSHASALVNGETVGIGDEINGATVIRIARDEVVLEIKGENLILSVPGADGRY